MSEAEFEIIKHIGGEEPPQLVIVDESVRDRNLVREIVRRSKNNNSEGILPVHIGYDGSEKGMSDSEIIELGKTLGYPHILTHDTHFYRFKKKYDKSAGIDGGRIIVLKQMDSMSNYLKRIRQEGIKIEGNGYKPRMFV